MAWARTALTAAQIANRAADKPLWCPYNQLITAMAAGACWWVDAIGGADLTHASYPTKRLYDRYGHAPSKPDHAIDDYFYITMDKGGASWPAFDVLAFIGHNFAACGAAADDDLTSVTVRISDVANFASGYIIAQWQPTAVPPSIQQTSSKRLVEPVLYSSSFGGAPLSDDPGPFSWSGGRYMAIQIGAAAPHDLTALPYLSELWMGSRTQLLWHPDYPWAPHNTDSSVADAVAQSRVATRYHYGTVRDFDWEYVTDDTTEVAAIKAGWKLRRGAPSLLLPEPNTDHQNAMLVLPNPEGLILPWEGGPYERHWRTHWTECAPSVDDE